MPQKMKISELKKSLNNLDRKELEQLICEMYKKNTFSQSMINTAILGDDFEKQLLEEYKEKMYDIHFPDNFNKGFSQSTAKKLISEYKKISQNEQYIVDLMLYYVECGTSFTNTFGDIDERFYNSLISVFGNVIKIINAQKDEKLFSFLEERLDALERSASDIGWGYGDYIEEENSEIQWRY